MENPENNFEQQPQQPEPNTLPSESMHIDQPMKDDLMEASKWMKFMAIIGFISIGLIVLLGLFMMMSGGGRTMRRMYGRGASPALMGFVYIILAIIYFFPMNYLFRSALGITNGLITGDKYSLKEGFANLRSHYRYIGIATIIILSLYVFILFVAFLGMASRM